MFCPTPEQPFTIPQSVVPVLLLPALQRHSLSLSLHDTGRRRVQQRPVCRDAVLSIPGETPHTKWLKLQRSTRNCWEKSESRGVSGLGDCSSPRKTGRQNQRCSSVRTLRFDIIFARTGEDIKDCLNERQ